MPNHFTVVAIGFPRWSNETDDLIFDISKFNEHEGDHNFCNIVEPMPEEVAVEAPGINPPWLVWAKEHWGTKWGTYRERAFALGGDGSPIAIEFQCAWCPPHSACLEKIRRWLDHSLGIEGVMFTFCNPYDNSVTQELVEATQ